MKKSVILFSPVLFPFSLLYGIVTYIRNKLFDYKILKSCRFKIPVISVGNITVGGTGKTPHIEYLGNLLKSEFNVAVLSRGYKRKTKGFLLATDKSTANDVGDESRQIKQKFPDVAVAVDADRVNGINQLIKPNQNINVVLLDDAFQHRRISPSLSVLLVDYSKPIFNDYMLPFGRLREPAFGKKRADVIIVTKCPKELTNLEQEDFIKKLKPTVSQQVFFSTFQYGKLKLVFSEDEIQIDDSDFKGYDILMVTGIANPNPLKEYIQQKFSGKIHSMIFPDHYDFKLVDIKKIEQTLFSLNSEKKIIITTEKDAMRLYKFDNLSDEIKKAFYYIPIQVTFLNKQASDFNQLILKHVSKDERDSILYTK